MRIFAQWTEKLQLIQNKNVGIKDKDPEKGNHASAHFRYRSEPSVYLKANPIKNTGTEQYNYRYCYITKFTSSKHDSSYNHVVIFTSKC